MGIWTGGGRGGEEWVDGERWRKKGRGQKPLRQQRRIDAVAFISRVNSMRVDSKLSKKHK